MTMEMKEAIKAAGVNVEMLLERSGGSEKLMLRLLKLFLLDNNYEKLKAALEQGDREAALNASHTLKGVTGNLSMDSLYEQTGDQVKAMRAGNWEQAEKLMDGITVLYQTAKEGIGAVLRECEE